MLSQTPTVVKPNRIQLALECGGREEGGLTSGYDQEASDDARAYWVAQMEAGMGFVERVLAHPVEERGEPLIDIPARGRTEGVEMLFSTKPHAAGRRRLFLARPPVVEQLLAVAAELDATGHRLLVEDAFRTKEMQRDLALTDEILGYLKAAIRRTEPGASSARIGERLSVLVAACPKGAGHMAGAAVDVTVIGPDGLELDRGGPYITVSEAMPMDSPFVSPEAAEKRRFITALMERHGFHPFPYEFWHYSMDDAFARVRAEDPAAAAYGPVDVQPDGTVVPTENQLERLYDPDVLKAHWETARSGHA